MGKAIWVGELREDLFNLSWQEFHKKHPDILHNTYKGKRSYWAKKLSIDLKELKVEQGRLSKTWEAAAYNRETQEWETTTLHSYDHIGVEDAWQAEPANITPNNREPKNADYQDIFIFTDPQIGYRNILNRGTGVSEHIPTHDEVKMRTARRIADWLRPDIIINLGDTIDLAEFSRFPADSNHYNAQTFEHSLQRVHDMYGEYRSDHPNAQIIEVSSNHNERFNKTLLKVMPQAYNVKRAGDDSKYPMMSYPYMANLEHVNVEFIEAYPAGVLIIERVGRAALRFAHGTETSSGMSSAASKSMRNHPETNNFQGHDHKDSEAWHTLNNGEQVGTWVFGALCNSLGLVPSTHSSVTSGGEPVRYQENWTSSVGHLRLYANGELEVNRIMINKDGVAHYQGKVFDGNE